MIKDYQVKKINFVIGYYFKWHFSTKPRQIIFIRHARSQFNDACEQFRVENSLPWDWNSLISHPDFDQQVAFNKKYMDCNLTQEGIQQCIKARQKFRDQQINLILVSPQQRALQTCEYIFQKRNIPVKVIPILNGPLWSACDISGSYVEKMLKYSKFDFRETQKQGQFWYLTHLSKEEKQLCLNEFQKRNVKTFLQQKLIILELLRKKKIVESASYLRQRSQKLKEYLRNLPQQYTKIVIVSHFYKIQYAISKEFSQKNQPLHKIDIPNCTPYRISFEELLKPISTIDRSAV